MNKRERLIRAMAESKAIHERGHFTSMDRHGVDQIVNSIESKGAEPLVVTPSDEANVLHKLLETVNG